MKALEVYTDFVTAWFSTLDLYKQGQQQQKANKQITLSLAYAR